MRKRSVVVHGSLLGLSLLAGACGSDESTTAAGAAGTAGAGALGGQAASGTGGGKTGGSAGVGAAGRSNDGGSGGAGTGGASAGASGSSTGGAGGANAGAGGASGAAGGSGVAGGAGSSGAAGASAGGGAAGSPGGAGGSAGGAGSSGGSGSALVLTVDFGEKSAAFPATVSKIGFNSFWNATTNDDNHDTFVMERSSRYRAPMIGALIEPKSLMAVGGFTEGYEEWFSDQSVDELEVQGCALWEPGKQSTLFRKSGKVVEARTPTDTDLAAIREGARSRGLVNLLQIAGTPGAALPTANGYDNGLFTLVGEPTTGGNWYPLPADDALPDLAHAFGTLPNALGYDTRTIYAFWQEPSHTIDEKIGAGASVAKYTELYWRTARDINEMCRWESCPMAGAQLNSNDGESKAHDGDRYKWFTDAVRAARVAHPGTSIPLDYFTIQNYTAQLSADVIANARVALGEDFAWTPILMNEWDYCATDKQGVNGCADNLKTFDQRYDEEKAWNVLRWLKLAVDAPDVSHVLLREKVLKDKAANGSYSFPWIQVPTLFMGAMSELRRPVEGAVPELPMLASGDADQLTMMLWNEAAEDKAVTLDLRNLATSFAGQTLSIKAISSEIRKQRCPKADVLDAQHAITCWADVVAPIAIDGASLVTPTFVVKPDEVVMIMAGQAPAYRSPFTAAHFVRARQHTQRVGEADPKGAGHFDPQTATLTVSTRGDGVGLARALLREVPATLKIRSRVAIQQAAAPTTVAGIRVDYYDDQHVLLKSVFHRDARYAANEKVGWGALDWPLANKSSDAAVDLCGPGCVGGEGAEVTIDVLGNAPPAWGATRFAEVGVVLANAGNDAIYRVALR